MATWKKVLIWASVIILAFIILFVIVIVTAYKTPMPQVPLGRYNLTKITQFAGESEEELERFDNGEFYLTIKDKNILESSSPGHGIEPIEGQYYYYLSGNEMPIYRMSDEKFVYAALYEDGLIKMYIKDGVMVTYYYYNLVKS